MKFIYNHPELKHRRRELRKKQTSAEQLLWNRLRGRQLKDARFLRQYSVGPFILDFYTPAFRLAVELDGIQHGDDKTQIYDQERSMYLAENRIRVLRFWNKQILEDIDTVIESIEQQLKAPLLL